MTSRRQRALGADVPFCLRGGHALVGGVGEILDPLPMVDASYVLLIPAIAVSTASVYAAFDELDGIHGGGGAANDLEKAALAVQPRLARYRDLLRDVSVREPQLAGSGATWFVETAASDAARIGQEVRSAVVESGAAAAVLATRTCS